MGYKYKERFEITKNNYDRFYEIAFYRVFTNFMRDIPNEKLDYFLEHYCKVFEIDFTTISILKNMYLKKLAPTKLELAVFNRIIEVPVADVPLDYRTYRKHIKAWVKGGGEGLNPMIVNAHMKPILKKFVDSFITLMYDDITFLKNLQRIKLDENKN
jgi:hypothetical protein